MRFVDDDRVVTRKPFVTLDFREQNTIRHELDDSLVADHIMRSHLEADEISQRHLQFFRNATGDTACSKSSWLRTSDHAGFATTSEQCEFGNLRGFARACFTGDHNDRVRCDGVDDFLRVFGNRQLVVDIRLWQLLLAVRANFQRCRQRFRERFLLGNILRLSRPLIP